jgi:AraC-like DNA-binding protein
LTQFVDILRFMTAGCLILTVIILVRSEVTNHQKIPASLLSICVLGYLIVDWEPVQQQPAFYFLLIPAIALPFSFWLFSQSLFNDGFRLRRWMGLVLIGFLLIQLTFFVISYQSLDGRLENINRIVSISQHILPLLFVMLGIISAVQGREADLIAARFQFRTYFILLTASLIFLTLLSEIAFQGSDVPSWLDLSQKLFIAGLTFFFASHRLIIKPGFFLVLDLPPSQPRVLEPEVDNAILTKLIELMDQQQHWRTEGLTIRRLAETMQVKEYKLRNTINQHLEFRNFNDFLHSYRIKEACNLLSNPEKKEVTILEIAYEMGYASLAPFNKAFKQITNMTPTEWRRSKML